MFETARLAHNEIPEFSLIGAWTGPLLFTRVKINDSDSTFGRSMMMLES